MVLVYSQRVKSMSDLKLLRWGAVKRYSVIFARNFIFNRPNQCIIGDVRVLLSKLSEYIVKKYNYCDGERLPDIKQLCVEAGVENLWNAMAAVAIGRYTSQHCIDLALERSEIKTRILIQSMLGQFNYQSAKYLPNLTAPMVLARVPRTCLDLINKVGMTTSTRTAQRDASAKLEHHNQIVKDRLVEHKHNWILVVDDYSHIIAGQHSTKVSAFTATL